MVRSLRYPARVLLFAFFLFLFDRSLFFLIQSFQRVTLQRESFKKRFIRFPPGTYSTLIMGSSRAFRGIHPHYLYEELGEKAYKIARHAAGPKFNCQFYDQYKRFAGVPRVVIYGVDYFMFALHSPQWFLKYLDDAEADAETWRGGPLHLLSNKARIDSFISTWLNRLNQGFRADGPERRSTMAGEVDDFIGFPAGDPLPTRKPVTFRKIPYSPYPGREGTYFHRLLETLERDGVTTVLVILPDFIGTYETNFERERFLEDIRRLIRPFSHVVLLDYNRPDVFPLSRSRYFKDGGYGFGNSHLSREGGRLFNRLLIEDLKATYAEGGSE